MKMLLPTMAALALLGSTAAMANGPPLPRAYGPSDCQELTSQLDDSMRTSNLPSSTAAAIGQERAYAERACSAGQFDVGARQLRDALDQVIAGRI